MDDASQPVPLGNALLAMVRHPLTLLRNWNWKTGMFSAMLRGGLFFVTNLHAGRARAGEAMLVEFLYAPVAAGVAGAITQRLRQAVPRAATGFVVWLGIPAMMLAAQAALHFIMRTPRMRTGLLASFVFAAFASGFNWFAMSHGAFVTGEGRSFRRDLLVVPKLLLQFVAAPFARSFASAAKEPTQ